MWRSAGETCAWCQKQPLRFILCDKQRAGAMKSERKAAVPDVVSNAERLLADAELLIEHGRFASAFVLAVLALEEVGNRLRKLGVQRFTR
jgi:hypothetical protein